MGDLCVNSFLCTVQKHPNSYFGLYSSLVSRPIFPSHYILSPLVRSLKAVASLHLVVPIRFASVSDAYIIPLPPVRLGGLLSPLSDPLLGLSLLGFPWSSFFDHTE